MLPVAAEAAESGTGTADAEGRGTGVGGTEVGGTEVGGTEVSAGTADIPAISALPEPGSGRWPPESKEVSSVVNLVPPRTTERTTSVPGRAGERSR